MSIEAIGSGVASVASAVGRGVSSVGRISAEAGSAVGPLMGSIGRIVNEGPVGLAALKLTVPLGEIKFGNEPLSAPSIPLETEPAFFQAQKPAMVSNFEPEAFKWIPAFAGMTVVTEPAELPQVEPMVMPFPKPEAVVFPALEPAVQAGPQTESGVANEVGPATATQPALEEQEVEESVTERVIAKQIDIVEEEKFIRGKKFVVDKPTLAHRLQEVRQAVQQAKLEAERLGLGQKIIGWIVNKFLSLSHQGDISQIVQPEGPDGTIPATREEISAKGEFESEEKVETAVLNNIPISAEEDGESVTDEQVRKVHQDLLVKPSKPEGPVNIVEKRTTQKKQQPSRQRPVLALAGGQAEAKKENNLRDLGLEEVFPKAA